MKKILSLLLTLCLSLMLISCTEDNKIIQEEQTQPPSTIEPSENDPNNSSETKSTETKNCRLFFYDIDEDKLLYIDKDLEITDKAIITALNSAHKEGISENDMLITLRPDAEVSSAKIENGILKVYFNEEFATNMNLGSGAEVGLIDSLVNTYGYNLNVKKVAIYSDGELFTGVRGENSLGYYKVDFSNSEPLS